MTKIIIDFETYSPESLIDSGSVKYIMHPEADIVCMAYKVEDGPVRVWVPGMTIPEILFNPESILYAHNALFDFLAFSVLGYKYNFESMPLERWVDTMALANRYTLPSGLDQIGNILDVEVKKDKRGKILIKKICVPTKDGQRPIRGIHYSEADYQDFLKYCADDVESTYHVVNSLPSNKLTPCGQSLWVLTQKMNLNGLPVDIDSARKILDYISGYSDEMTRRVPEITGYTVNKVTQTAKMLEWLNSHGCSMPNMQAGTVEKELKRDDLPKDTKELLQLRVSLGKSSTAKYSKLIDMEYNGRVYNNLQYHVASTGRWGGRGFQMHNLPRAKVKNPEELIEAFNNFEPIEDPVNVAKALIRPMIYSGPNRSLLVSDYKSIENRLLAFVANDQKTLQAFRDDEDQYKAMAAYLFQIPISEVNDFQRQIGKVIILGCGYGMGAERFKETAAAWGIMLTLAESQAAVDAYREMYHLVKKLWYALKNACVKAIANPGRAYKTNECIFQVVRDRVGRDWLMLTLPSGRNLFYMDPYLEDGEYGVAPGHWGVNPYSKKWSEMRLIPGRITENIIQGLAYDIMGNGLLEVDKHMPEVNLIGTVHDEGIGEIDDENIRPDTLDTFNKLLCSIPEWAEGLPLEAEGYIAKRYRKG